MLETFHFLLCILVSAHKNLENGSRERTNFRWQRTGCRACWGGRLVWSLQTQLLEYILLPWKMNKIYCIRPSPRNVTKWDSLIHKTTTLVHWLILNHDSDSNGEAIYDIFHILAHTFWTLKPFYTNTSSHFTAAFNSMQTSIWFMSKFSHPFYLGVSLNYLHRLVRYTWYVLLYDKGRVHPGEIASLLQGYHREWAAQWCCTASCAKFACSPCALNWPYMWIWLWMVVCLS